jgi:O-antigen ligase
MLISVWWIQGSHFEGMYLCFRYAFFACTFLSLANYTRYQSARWRGLLLGSVIAVNLGYLLPDLLLQHGQVMGFSNNNANYFATFLLIGLAASMAVAVFGIAPAWRAAAAVSAALILFGIVKTASRGGTLAGVAMVIVIAIRARGRIPRQLWIAVGVLGLLTAVVSSPFLVRKFIDRNNVDPYNYARTQIWLGSLKVVAHSPLAGVGFGQFYHISKRYTEPIDGFAARYLKRAQMAHNEYLQHIAELGIPTALLLFALLGYPIYLAGKRAATAWPEFRAFHEAALLTVVGVGTHALVDNAWTIPVTASAIVVLSLADLLPLQKKEPSQRWSSPRIALVSLVIAAVYIFSTAIPGLALYYNDSGHKAYDRGDFATAERLHLAALKIVPNHPLFLDNLGMVYLQGFTEMKDPKLLYAARHYFEQSIASTPQALDPHIHMETVLMRLLSGDAARDRPVYEDIVRVDSELLEIDPYIPFVRKNLASAYYNLGQRQRAFDELQKAIGYEPNYVPGYLQIAAWYGAQGDTASSQRYTAAAINIVNKYRNFKPTEAYEGLLLARPEASYVTLTGQNR